MPLRRLFCKGCPACSDTSRDDIDGQIVLWGQYTKLKKFNNTDQPYGDFCDLCERHRKRHHRGTPKALVMQKLSVKDSDFSQTWDKERKMTKADTETMYRDGGSRIAKKPGLRRVIETTKDAEVEVAR